MTDPGWQVPHFEKMLYDNALLAELYFEAADVLGEPAFERIATDTVEFMLRELASPLGGFYSSLSAVDGDGVEGGYYLFDATDLDSVLDEEERRVADIAWGLGGAPAIEHGHLPVQAAESRVEVARGAGLSVEEAAARLDSARRKLLGVRARRVLPRDEKRLAGWNGLALSALVRASLRRGGARFEAPARGVVRFLTGDLWDGTTLVRARADEGTEERSIAPATLQDYAYVARGMIAFAEAHGREKHWELARGIVEGAWRRFHTAGGWRLSDAAECPTPVRKPPSRTGRCRRPRPCSSTPRCTSRLISMTMPSVRGCAPPCSRTMPACAPPRSSTRPASARCCDGRSIGQADGTRLRFGACPPTYSQAAALDAAAASEGVSGRHSPAGVSARMDTPSRTPMVHRPSVLIARALQRHGPASPGIQRVGSMYPFASR